MPLKPNPELVAAAEAKRAQASRGKRPPDAVCTKCGDPFGSGAELEEHTIEKHPTGIFTPQVQEQFLMSLRDGKRRHSTARKLGVSPSLVAKFLELNPAFARAVQMAEEEYIELVETALYDAALNKEPWAVKEVLTKRNAKRWGDPGQKITVEHTGTVTHEIDDGHRAQQISTITERLRQRALMDGNIIDAEIVED